MVDMLTPARDRIAASVERLTPLIEKLRDEGERERRTPAALVDAMRAEGLFKVVAPREYGGDELDIASFVSIIEAFARSDAATAWTYANLAAGTLLSAFVPESCAREMFANGPNVTIPGSIKPNGAGVPVPGGYKLNGRWSLASGSDHGDWLGLVGVVLEDNGPRMTDFGVPDFQAFFLPRAQAQVIDTWHSFGLRGSGSNDVTVTDLFVPLEHTFPLLAERQQVAGALYHIGILPLFSLALTGVVLGTARAAIDAFVALAKEKTPTMSQTGLATRPTIHAGVARAEAELGAARAYVYEVARELMQSVEADASVPEQLEAKRRLACNIAAETCTRVVDDMVKLAGATPVYSGNVLERCLRDIHTAAQHLSFSPVWWEKTGQSYFGLGLGMP